jgi:polar amino acid transport system substrate-binding protein
MRSGLSRLRLSLRALLAAALAGHCAGIFAADGLDRARQRGKLVAGIRYVVPEYKGGMKFRTPEAIDNALLADVARRAHLPLATVPAQSGRQAPLLAARDTDLALVALPDNDPLRRNATVIPTGYAAGPMAIMRTDTDIKSWVQLKGRKVCVSEGGSYVGAMAAQYGATEIVHRAPADALIALRIGACDATVHDHALLEELLKLPEWKKFSARLPVGPRTTLAFVVPPKEKSAAAFLTQIASEWEQTGHVQQQVKKAAHNIAFEVYLDQDVPDCH